LINTARLEKGQLCCRFWFVHETGDRLYPYVKQSTQSRQIAFAVAKPGTGNNLSSMEIPVTDDVRLEALVLVQHYSVRCRTAKNRREGLYNINGRSILRAERAV